MIPNTIENIQNPKSFEVSNNLHETSNKQCTGDLSILNQNISLEGARNIQDLSFIDSGNIEEQEETFFLGNILNEQELNRDVLLSKKEMKMIPKQRIGCSDSSCVICFDKYEKGQVIRNLPCGHFFHYGCLKQWLKTSHRCPICRFDLKSFCKEKLREKQVQLQKNKSNLEIKDCLESKRSVKTGDGLENNQLVKRSFVQFDFDFESIKEDLMILEDKLEVSGGQKQGFSSLFDEYNQVKSQEKLRKRLNEVTGAADISFLQVDRQPDILNFTMEVNLSRIE